MLFSDLPSHKVGDYCLTLYTKETDGVICHVEAELLRKLSMPPVQLQRTIVSRQRLDLKVQMDRDAS